MISTVNMIIMMPMVMIVVVRRYSNSNNDNDNEHCSNNGKTSAETECSSVNCTQTKIENNTNV